MSNAEQVDPVFEVASVKYTRRETDRQLSQSLLLVQDVLADQHLCTSVNH